MTGNDVASARAYPFEFSRPTVDPHLSTLQVDTLNTLRVLFRYNQHGLVEVSSVTFHLVRQTLERVNRTFDLDAAKSVT